MNVTLQSIDINNFEVLIDCTRCGVSSAIRTRPRRYIASLHSASEKKKPYQFWG